MGIPGFEPSFLAGVDAIQAVHGSRLAALAGRRLTGFAVVRFAEDGEWFADCPVVLDFDGIPFTGRELREVALLEWRPSGPDLAAGTVAVEFAFGTGRFHIANGLDENRIETGAAQPDYVRHRLSR
jgi:hypothetical protein